MRGENRLLFYFSIHIRFVICPALGDTPFKLPPVYTERVLAFATPSFDENYRVKELLARNPTPPYLSNQAEVKHIDLVLLSSTGTPVLVLCSDGLRDLYSRCSKEEDNIGCPALDHHSDSDNLDLDLLCDAFGRDDAAYNKII